MKKVLFFLILLCPLVGAISVNAAENNLTVEDFYRTLENNEVISQELIDFGLKEGLILSSEIKYVEEIISHDSLGNVHVVERNLTEEEYDNYNPVQPLYDCGPLCVETNAKKFTAFISSTQYLSRYNLYACNQWKMIPKIKSFDTIAVRWTTTGDVATEVRGVSGNQQYSVNGKEDVVIYNENTANTKIASNGVGISMNIVDSVTGGLVNLMNVDIMIYGVGTFTQYSTYQHATQNINLATAQNYTFGPGGLGGVLVYNGTAGGYFDQMQGLMLTTNIPSK